MKRSQRRLEDERVEMLSGDADLFDVAGPRTESPPEPNARRSRTTFLVAAGIALAAVAAFVAWPRSAPPSPVGTAPSSSAAPSTVVAPPTTAPGRDAPVPSTDVAFALVVQPSTAGPATPVTMHLEGDLSGVSSRIAAVAWVDALVAGEWRTVHWMARSSATAQTDGHVSNDAFASGPDALTYDAGDAVQFDVGALTPGRYRMCRYVPLRVSGTTTPPSPNPAYVCAPLVVDLFSPGDGVPATT